MITLAPVDPSAPVCVIMTVRNEAAHLADAMTSVLNNGFAPGVEVVVAVGPSDDDTRAIAERLAADPRVRVIDNPSGGTPQGLNLALAAAQRDVIIRMDGHAVMPEGYIECAVHALVRTGAANVGGRMVPQAHAPFARAVAVAMASPWGIGGGGHRVGGDEGPTDSVFLGAFRREALDAVKGYDEHFTRAQDWELNFRLREAGYVVWFEPTMAVSYRPRATVASLARQFFTSGQWRREVMRVHHLSTSVKYLAPPLVAVLNVLAVVCAVAGGSLFHPWWWAALAVPVGYLAGVMAASATLARKAGKAGARWLPVVLVTMHMAWGAGFVRGVR